MSGQGCGLCVLRGGGGGRGVLQKCPARSLCPTAPAVFCKCATVRASALRAGWGCALQIAKKELNGLGVCRTNCKEGIKAHKLNFK